MLAGLWVVLLIVLCRWFVIHAFIDVFVLVVFELNFSELVALFGFVVSMFVSPIFFEVLSCDVIEELVDCVLYPHVDK